MRLYIIFVTLNIWVIGEYQHVTFTVTMVSDSWAEALLSEKMKRDKSINCDISVWNDVSWTKQIYPSTQKLSAQVERQNHHRLPMEAGERGRMIDHWGCWCLIGF